MFQRVSLLADSRSRPFRRIAIPFFFFFPSLLSFLCSSSPLVLGSYHFFRRILPRPTFSDCTETLSGEPRLRRNSPGFRDVSNVLEFVERELNMGISNAAGERAVQISWVVRTRGFPARITALLVLHTRDPGKCTVRLRAVTLRRIRPTALRPSLLITSARYPPNRGKIFLSDSEPSIFTSRGSCRTF